MSSFEGSSNRADNAAQPSRQQSEFEIEFFRRVLERQPDNLDVLRLQAQLLTSTGRRAEGLTCDRRLVALLPDDPEVRYHLACSLAAVGKTDEAASTLLEAVELGYRDFAHLESDPDLDSLHEHPLYQALLRGHGMES
jgi:adenylate cyclase